MRIFFQRNLLTVKVTPPLLNALIGRALEDDPYAKQMIGMKDKLTPVGLLGPVTLFKTSTATPAPQLEDRIAQ